MFDKQIQKAVDAVGDEKKAVDIIGYAIIVIVIICATLLYIIWRPRPTPKIDKPTLVPGATQQVEIRNL